MSRIAKARVYQVLDRAADHIVQAGGTDGRTSRAEMQAKLKTLSGKEKSLTDMFFRWIDHRDAAPGASITQKDIRSAREAARQELVIPYDKNNNGLDTAEVDKMSTIGKLAVGVVRDELAVPAKKRTGAEIAKRLAAAAKGLVFDYYGTEGTTAKYSGFSAKSLGPKMSISAFRRAMKVPADHQIEQRSISDFFKAMKATGPDAPNTPAARKQYAALEAAMKEHLKDLTVFIVGKDGQVANRFAYFAGRAPDGGVAGLKAPIVWT